MANGLGLPQGQKTPDWYQDFVMQTGPQQGQAGWYADQWTDIARQYQKPLQNIQNQYGMEAVNNPAFLQAGKNDFTQFNPFEAGDDFGSVAGFDWQWNPFTGLKGVDQGLDYLGHYITHSDAAMKGAQKGVSGDRSFFARYGMYPDSQGSALYTGDEGYGQGSALYGEDPNSRMRNVLDMARGDYNDLLAIQQRYGY